MKIKNFIISALCLVLLFGCSACSLNSKPSCTFIFKSDYCDLNNIGNYSKGSEVNLTLNVKENYNDYYVVPDDIYVLIGDKECVNGSDYTYVTDETQNKATLTLTVTDNVVITALYKNSNNVFRVGANEFNDAINLEDEEYVQFDYFYSVYTENILQLNEVIMYLSPTINMSETLRHYNHDGIYEEIEYYKNLDGNIRIFKDNEWQDGETSDFKRPQDLSIVTLLTILDNITYETKLKGNFDETINAYCFTVNKNYEYQVTMSFREKKLVQFSYYYDMGENRGVYCSYSYTYNKITPELPPNALSE